MLNPTSKTDLQRLLEMIAHVSKVILNLSLEPKNFQKLVLREKISNFNKTHEKIIWCKLKSRISTCTHLKPFDPKMPFKVTSVTSKKVLELH